MPPPVRGSRVRSPRRGEPAIAAGTSENVAVVLDGGALRGTEYVAMTRYKTAGNGGNDFGPGGTDVDTPGLLPDDTARAAVRDRNVEAPRLRVSVGV